MARDFSLLVLYSTQTSCEALNLEVKWLGPGADHSTSSSAEAKNDGAMLQSPKHIHGIMLLNEVQGKLLLPSPSPYETLTLGVNLPKTVPFAGE